MLLLMTDEDGDLAWDAIYKPFGEIYSAPTADITNNFRFPGQYDDLITGLYYNHNRYYIPSLGRYNRVDPIGLDNPYIYALNNPVNIIDPFGLWFYWPQYLGGIPDNLRGNLEAAKARLYQYAESKQCQDYCISQGKLPNAIKDALDRATFFLTDTWQHKLNPNCSRISFCAGNYDHILIPLNILISAQHSTYEDNLIHEAAHLVDDKMSEHDADEYQKACSKGCAK